MAVSKGAKIIAAVIAAILIILLLVAIILLATHGHDDDTGTYVVKEEFVKPLNFKINNFIPQKIIKASLERTKLKKLSVFKAAQKS